MEVRANTGRPSADSPVSATTFVASVLFVVPTNPQKPRTKNREKHEERGEPSYRMSV